MRLADQEAERFLERVAAEKRRECWWLIQEDGTPIAGDQGGGVRLLSILSLTRPLGRALGALRLSPVVDAADARLARWRKRLGRFVPDGPAPRRFP